MVSSRAVIDGIGILDVGIPFSIEGISLAYSAKLKTTTGDTTLAINAIAVPTTVYLASLERLESP